MSVIIYHNPNCETSRTVLEMIKAKGHEPIVIDYLSDPPGRSDLVRLINHLRVSPWELLRKKEAKELGLRKETDLTRMISTLAKNPGLMEGPIVTTATEGRICNPARLVEQLVGPA